MMMKEQRQNRPIRRNIYLFDTFAGMTPPGESDVIHLNGVSASSVLQPELRFFPGEPKSC